VNRNTEATESNKTLDQAVDIAVRLAFIGLIVFWCTKIVAPFFLPVLWGAVIATALYPVFLKLKGRLGGRNTLAGAVFIVVSLALVLVPTTLLTESLISGATGLSHGIEEGTLTVPPPSDSVKEWPAIGEKAHAAWFQASKDFQATLAKYADQFRAFGNFLVNGAASLGGAVVQTVFSLILAGVFMMNAVGSGRVAYAFAQRIGGQQGLELVDISIATVRSVVKGVLLVAIIQSLMAAAGLMFAGVGGAGFWALIVLVLAIVQLPPILILGPIAAYVFSANDNTVVAVIFLVWSLVVSGADSFLKPMFLGRGVAVPMLVILVGAIGGMITAGVIGLFLGAVILSVGFKLVETYLGDSVKQEAPEG
jgi:predicted PurR-regulated permease PerM